MVELSRRVRPALAVRPSLGAGALLASVLTAGVLATAALPASADARAAGYQLGSDPFVQQGPRLSDSAREASFGAPVAISSDGSTALVGAPGSNGGAGSAWVFSRVGGEWVEQARLTGAGEIDTGLIGGQFGSSVALSADGSTALVGAPYDNAGAGGVWVFTRSGGTWTQQGSKLSGQGEVGAGQFGTSVALSADGSTALVGADKDNGEVGAAFVFARSGGSWAQQGAKLVASGFCGLPTLGNAVALSADGNTALIAGDYDCDVGAVWTFTRSGSSWSQQGSKLTAHGEVGKGFFGSAVALSADGATALIGADEDHANVGAAWAYTRSGSGWVQQGGELTGGGERGEGWFGRSLALSEDGNTAVIGGSFEATGENGSAWVFKRSGPAWSQQGAKLAGGGESSEPLTRLNGGGFGRSVALSGDGGLALVGGGLAPGLVGAVWTFQGGGSVAPAQFGRCIQVATAPGRYTGSYTSAACTTLGGRHFYEWFPGPASTHFKLASLPGSTVGLQTAKGTKLTCLSLAGAGEYTGNALSNVGALTLTLAGCELAGAKCASAGAASGEILSTPLEGALGITKLAGKSANNGVGLSIHPAGAGAGVAQFACGASSVSIRGSVVGSIAANKMLPAIPLSFASSKGKQKPEGFAGQGPSLLEVSRDGGPYEQAALTLKASLVGEEALEVDSAFSEVCSPSPSRRTGRAHKPKGHAAARVLHGRQCTGAVAHKPAHRPRKRR